MNLLEEFIVIITHLDDSNIPYAICGGWALAIHGVPRLTRDINLLVIPGDFANVVDVATRCGFDSVVESLSLAQRDGTKCEMRRLNKFQGEDHVILDVILAQESLASIWSSQTKIEWNGRFLHVCSALGLAQMKWLSGRPQDLLDIQSLGFDIHDATLQNRSDAG